MLLFIYFLILQCLSPLLSKKNKKKGPLSPLFLVASKLPLFFSKGGRKIRVYLRIFSLSALFRNYNLVLNKVDKKKLN